MPLENLKQTLRDLHNELASTPAVDAESRALLTSLAEEIDDVLHPAAPPMARDDSLTERLTHVRQRFEEDHPQIAAIVGRIAEGLSQLGI